MSQVLIEKATMLGISEEDIQAMTPRQLANEVRNVSLNSNARNNMEGRQAHLYSVDRTTLPDPVYISRSRVV